MLLFHLLLKPKELNKLMGNHPGGGVPSWLLEVDDDDDDSSGSGCGMMLSFASLSHYHYYGGNDDVATAGMNDNSIKNNTNNNDDHDYDQDHDDFDDDYDSDGFKKRSSFTTKKNKHRSKHQQQQHQPHPIVAPKELRANILSTIETLAVLLHTPDDHIPTSPTRPQHPLRQTTDTTEITNNTNSTINSHITPYPMKTGISTVSSSSTPMCNNRTPNHHHRGKRGRALSYGDEKYHSARAHVMLAEYLQEVRGGGGDNVGGSNKKHRRNGGGNGNTSNGNAPPVFEDGEEIEARLELLDCFWGATSVLYGNLRMKEGIKSGGSGSGGSVASGGSKKKEKKQKSSKNSKYATNNNSNGDATTTNGTNSSWSLKEFITWADKALPDNTAIDVIMKQVFGMGLLPTPAMERCLVSHTWINWQMDQAGLLGNCGVGIGKVEADAELKVEDSMPGIVDSCVEGTGGIVPIFPSIRNLFNFNSKRADIGEQENISGAVGGTGGDDREHGIVGKTKNSNNNNNTNDGVVIRRPIWGGIGNYDGKGGLGYGVMYCIDKLWWDSWINYVGWSWTDDDNDHTYNHSNQLQKRLQQKLQRSRRIRSRNRPHDLSTEILLDRSSDSAVGGCQGSYEIMKHNLKKDVDYILVPPAVWDVLYELYGGGPPLPRMVARKDSWAVVTTSMAETTKTGGGVMLDDGVGVETVVRCDGG